MTLGPSRSSSSVPAPILPSADTFLAELVEVVAKRAADLVAERIMEREEPWLSVEDAARYLACGKSRVYAVTASGALPCVKDGVRTLLRRSEIDAYLARGGAIR